jgi:hypothetical protein
MILSAMSPANLFAVVLPSARRYTRPVALRPVVALLAFGAIAACSRESTRPPPWAPPVGGKLDAPDVEAARRPSPPPDGATQISLGLSHGCARMSDGTAWCWGDNDKGQLGDRTTVRRDGLVRTL